jgi:2-phospho-L-lactate guanylyltransferase
MDLASPRSDPLSAQRIIGSTRQSTSIERSFCRQREIIVLSITGLWAVIPVKNFENAKQRLSGTLSPGERKALFAAMVEDVLTALGCCDRLAGVLMVTRDAEASRLAERHGARVLIEETNAGHTEASTFGARTLAKEGAVGMIQIPGDLPAVTSEDIAAIIDAHGDAPAVTIAPSRDEQGSNAVACSPPDLLPLRFGDDSFFPHCAKARELGAEPRIVQRAGLGLDVDTPDDLRAFLASPALREIASHTARFLTESGVAARFKRLG